jgi:hypothetical protein
MANPKINVRAMSPSTSPDSYKRPHSNPQLSSPLPQQRPRRAWHPSTDRAHRARRATHRAPHAPLATRASLLSVLCPHRFRHQHLCLAQQEHDQREGGEVRHPAVEVQIRSEGQ